VMRAFSVYSAALYLGFLTPGRIGDFFKSVYLSGRGMAAGKAVYSSIVDRLFDLVFLAVIGFASLLTLPGIFENQLLLSGMILLCVAVVSAVLFFRRDLLARIAARFLSTAPEGSLRGNLDRAVSDAIGEFETLKRRGVAGVVALSAVAWTLHYGVFVLLADGLGTGASLHVLIVSVSAAIFTALIPVSLSGLGTRDVVLILVFGKVGLSSEAAVTFSLSFILVYLVQGLIGLACWLVAPIGREKKEGQR
ncbi:MAG TPA: lysylphosphatidylglycerol synthase transmembrane domain-containing protein, partial [Candidatus Krumholzibacterium sp.]|nr:lysylphosphatidylglycerol synthase transmembrane domain-containing protein [Candidatus Krumholzibacterium sp.]